MTEVEGPDGKTIYSKVFPVRRGVVQGDITSPLYFILALEAILRKYDSTTNKGTHMTHTNTWVHTLGYADDAVLVDENVNNAETRVNAIAQGSRKSADMSINVTKTECMHLQQQDPLRIPTAEEAKAQCKHKCPHIGCGKVFANKHGLRVHQGKCKMARVYEVEKILDFERNDPKASTPVGHGKTKFLIKWKGYSSKYNKWVTYEDVAPDVIKEFLQAEKRSVGRTMEAPLPHL